MLIPHNQGRHLFTSTRLVNETNGIYPWRVVIFTPSQTPASKSPKILVEYPTITISNGEVVDGVVVGPYSTLGGSLNVIPANHDCLVVNDGEVPVKCDTTVDTTAIAVGDLVASSETSGQDGCLRKATLTNNYPSAGQHIIGRSLMKASTEGQFCLTKLAIREV